MSRASRAPVRPAGRPDLSQLLVTLFLIGCHPGGAPAPRPMPPPAPFRATITEDSAVFLADTPEERWDRITALLDSAPGDRGSVMWLIAWDSTPRPSDPFGCCGLELEARLDSLPGVGPDQLLARANRSAYRVDQVHGWIALRSEPAFTARWTEGVLIMRIGPSDILGQLRRIRPDSIRLSAYLWAIDTQYVAWARPEYVR